MSEQFFAKLQSMVDEMERARVVSRDAIFRVVVLSAAIVGLSVTLLSVETLTVGVDRSLLQVPWFLFAVVVGIGPLSVFLESRTQYAITWRAQQAQEFAGLSSEITRLTNISRADAAPRPD